MKKIYAILVALSALSIVLMGCSKSDDSGKDTKTPDTSSSTTPSK